MATQNATSKATAAIEFTRQAEKLSLLPQSSDNEALLDTTAVEAKFITPQDPIIVTANGERLPAVPYIEAVKLNQLKEKLQRELYGEFSREIPEKGDYKNSVEVIEVPKGHTLDTQPDSNSRQSSISEGTLGNAFPPQRTHPLFPQLPLYGPPSILRNLQCLSFRISSFFLSLSFLGTIVLGSAFTSIPLILRHVFLRLTLRDPQARRPFYEEEKRRKQTRKDAAREWKRQKRRKIDHSQTADGIEEKGVPTDEYEPTEGGKDPLVCDAGYYARRVGLDIEEYRVLTEDGFIITLWHVYNPHEYTPALAAHREIKAPEVFLADCRDKAHSTAALEGQSGGTKRKYPVLLLHGLLQSSGAYCTNDDDSLAFFLCKR